MHPALPSPLASRVGANLFASRSQRSYEHDGEVEHLKQRIVELKEEMAELKVWICLLLRFVQWLRLSPVQDA